uniref:Retrotransposon protein, putative, Ty3-gypsy sub-class n=2 Tax=Oryza sativa subsp. japonica TaxID=39947 RepID=Q53KK1_ORYSJ|nr:retrotransposon protein, putative, Ty3-gypsy sub-class [Oryza sativa Japonica Group]AAX96068.1 retrotransposon protein, putative, Ty3-gypsy sub-class [Oryza sativa Japonica Group]ABA91857.1 retrotransposon protein, putative, Ty3-gypsy subclass [Oryza sativa Japonica Group]
MAAVPGKATAQREVDQRGDAARLEAVMVEVARDARWKGGCGDGMGKRSEGRVRHGEAKPTAQTARRGGGYSNGSVQPELAGGRRRAGRRGESGRECGGFGKIGEKGEDGTGIIFIGSGRRNRGRTWRIWGGIGRRRGAQRGRSGDSIWRQKLGKSGGFGGGDGGEPVSLGLGMRARAGVADLGRNRWTKWRRGRPWSGFGQGVRRGTDVLASMPVLALCRGENGEERIQMDSGHIIS